MAIILSYKSFQELTTSKKLLKSVSGLSGLSFSDFSPI